MAAESRTIFRVISNYFYHSNSNEKQGKSNTALLFYFYICTLTCPAILRYNIFIFKAPVLWCNQSMPYGISFSYVSHSKQISKMRKNFYLFFTQRRILPMTNALQHHFPMIRDRVQLLDEIQLSPALLSLFQMIPRGLPLNLLFWYWIL